MLLSFKLKLKTNLITAKELYFSFLEIDLKIYLSDQLIGRRKSKNIMNVGITCALLQFQICINYR